MKTLAIIATTLTISVLTQAGTAKRGIHGESLDLSSDTVLTSGFSSHDAFSSLPLAAGLNDLGTQFALSSSHGGALASETYGSRFDGASDFGHLESGTLSGAGDVVSKHVTITNRFAVPVPQPFAVPVTKTIAVPVPHPVHVPVDRPYAVRVPQPIPVPVDKPFPVPVEKPFPVPVPHPVPVKVLRPVPVGVPKPYPVPVVKHVPVPIPHSETIAASGSDFDSRFPLNVASHGALTTSSSALSLSSSDPGSLTSSYIAEQPHLSSGWSSKFSSSLGSQGW